MGAVEDIKDFIQKRVNECEMQSADWEEKIQYITIFMKKAGDDDIDRLKFNRQQCISKKNELLGIVDFCNELLLKYFL